MRAPSILRQHALEIRAVVVLGVALRDQALEIARLMKPWRNAISSGLAIFEPCRFSMVAT